MSRYAVRTNVTYLLFILPAFLLFTIIYIIPFIQGIPYSLTNWNGVSKNWSFIGLQNYIHLFRDREFGGDMVNTFYFTVLYLLLSNGFGLLFALMLYRNSKINSFLRSLFFVPFVISLITTAFIWRYLFTDVYSVIFHVPSPLGVVSQAMLGIVANAVWRDAGYCMIIYIAALQSIPGEYFEVAAIEGAGPFRRFFSVIVPSIMPAFTANVSLILAWGLKLFEYPMAATSGGPGNATESVAMYVYNNLFSFMKAGYGQAAAMLMTLMMVIVSTIVNHYLRTREVEA